MEGLLLGSIVASTDGAAVFSLLRGAGLRRRLERTLEGEAGFDDPIAVLLVLGFIEWVQHPDYGIADMSCSSRSSSGSACSPGSRSACSRRGVPAGAPLDARASTRSRRSPRPRWPSARPRRCTAPASSPSTSPGSCSAPPTCPAKRTVTAFHEGLAWVAQLGMFLTLGLLVFPSELGEVAGTGTLLALIVVFVARPLATLVSTIGSGFDAGRRCCSAGPGCAARCPGARHVPGARGHAARRRFFNIVFFAVLLSTLLQGTTIDSWRAGSG